MKMNVILKIVAMIVIVTLMSVGSVFAQRGTLQSSASMQAKISAARIKAADSLAKAEAQIQSNPALEAIYPPGFLDRLQGIADGTLSANSMIMADEMTPQNNPVPTDQTPVGQNYTVTDLGTLGGSVSYALGINANGQVVGDSDIGDNIVHAFLWSNGSMQDLGILSPEGNESYGDGINNSGQVVGCYYNQDYNIRAFLYSNGSMQDLGTLGGFSSYDPSYGYGINNSGQVVGNSGEHAFLWSSGIMHDLGTLGGNFSWAYAINDAGQVVGDSDIGDNIVHAFLWSNGSMQDLGILSPEGNESYGDGINNSGQVVGCYYNQDYNIRAFLYSNGSMQDLGTLGGSISMAYGINSSGQVVGLSHISDSVVHAFLYSGGVMQDLNSLIIPANSGWILVSATAINDSGQIVGRGTNPSGQTHAFLLNPLPVGTLLACTNNQTSTPIYGAVPPPEEGQDSLVFITHGWINHLDYSTEVAEATEFVNSSSNLINQYLINNGISNWQVYGQMWINEADAYLPGTALANAEQLGKIIGDSIVQGGWTNVYFIAHSAGAGMVQKATEEIRATSPVPVTIHCTFLDAYDGAVGEKASEYGTDADWSDSYFVRDQLQQAGWTGRLLPHAYNVDVTALDPQAVTELQGFVSAGDPGSPCTKVGQSNHGWPVEFYVNSIAGAIAGNLSSVFEGSYYDGFGFPLSQVGGSWDYALANYTPGNGVLYGSVTNLGPENDSSCTPIVYTSAYLGSGTSFPTLPTLESLNGTIQKALNSLWIQTGSSTPQNNMASVRNMSASPLDSETGSPVWIATVITDTNALNFVSFDAEFTSDEGSDGLLSVYWDTNMIGLIDEVAVQPGFQHYTLSFPNATANTSHVLGFHLDPFTSVQSSITLTNVITGFAGVSQSPVLAITTNTVNGLLVYRLTGQVGSYTVQASADLTTTNWLNIAILANTTGTVDFVDSNSTNYLCRFYRAISQ